MSKSAKASNKVTPQELWSASKAKTIAKAKAEGRKLKSWEVAYETIDRWSHSDLAVAEERVKAIAASSSLLKKELADAARAVEEGTHEQINASSQAGFLIKVAIGEQKSTSGRIFERTAELEDGSRASITRLAAAHRLPTVEFLTPPVAAKSVKSVFTRIREEGAESDDEELNVLAGHVGSASFKVGDSTPTYVVSAAASSTGKKGIHAAQLAAQKESSHHLSLSRRLSSRMDEFQEDGTGILEAFDAEGFHEGSSWGGFSITSAEDALAVAMKARHNFKKRQTKEKELRKPYAEPDSISEEYTEIRTESETASDSYKDYAKKVAKEKLFKDFAKEHKISVNSKAFKAKLEELHEGLSRDDGRE